jgi:hypothetical protein
MSGHSIVINRDRPTQRGVPCGIIRPDFYRNIFESAKQYARSGYRRVVALLHQLDWPVSPKRVTRPGSVSG